MAIFQLLNAFRENKIAIRELKCNKFLACTTNPMGYFYITFDININNCTQCQLIKMYLCFIIFVIIVFCTCIFCFFLLSSCNMGQGKCPSSKDFFFMIITIHLLQVLTGHKPCIFRFYLKRVYTYIQAVIHIHRYTHLHIHI